MRTHSQAGNGEQELATSAIKVESVDPVNRHAGCIIVAEIAPNQIVSVWDSDIGGGDASMPTMCAHAAGVAPTVLAKF